MVYSISYDLNSPGQNYESLYDSIKTLGSWARPLKSTWLVDTDYSATQIRKILSNNLDSNDSICISRFTDYSVYVDEKVIHWLNKHI